MAAILKSVAAMILLYLLLVKVFQPWFSAYMTDGVSTLKLIEHSKVEQKK